MGRILPYKVGICIGCLELDKKLIAKRCFEAPCFCYQKYQKARYQAKQQGKIAKKKLPISPISVSKMKELRLYRKVRDEKFKETPVCEFPECNSTEISLHHSRGRVGSFLTDKIWMRSLCWPHHQFCENNPAEAQRLQLSFKRLTK